MTRSMAWSLCDSWASCFDTEFHMAVPRIPIQTKPLNETLGWIKTGISEVFIHNIWKRWDTWLTLLLATNRQELSYRQQIARQLRPRYAEGIYRHKYYTVTLKSRLSVIQGHWKRNHWIDHTRLSSSRVFWRWILLWPWNVGYRSLKIIESGNIWKLGYGFLFALYSNYGRICSRLWDIQCQTMEWPWKPG